MHFVILRESACDRRISRFFVALLLRMTTRFSVILSPFPVILILSEAKGKDLSFIEILHYVQNDSKVCHPAGFCMRPKDLKILRRSASQNDNKVFCHPEPIFCHPDPERSEGEGSRRYGDSSSAMHLGGFRMTARFVILRESVCDRRISPLTKLTLQTIITIIYENRH